MPLAPNDRFLPCLLHRLKMKVPEASGRGYVRGIRLDDYVASVYRDLENLLTSSAREPDDELYQYPEVAASVLNYGLPPLFGLTASGISTRDIEKQLTDAIRRFEPRIMPETLAVRVEVNSEKTDIGSIQVRIEADVWADPSPEHILVATRIDIDSGMCRIEKAQQ